MPLAPSAFRLQDAFGSFIFRLQDALSSFCRMPLAPFFFQDPLVSFLRGKFLRFVLTDTYCSSGSQLASCLDLRWAIMVSVETFVIQPFLVEIPMPPVMKRRSEFLFVLVMKLLESGRHARHWQSSCFLVAAPFTILTACRVLVLSLFMKHLYIICFVLQFRGIHKRNHLMSWQMTFI